MFINYIQKYTRNTNGITNKNLVAPLQKNLINALFKLYNNLDMKKYEIGLVISPGYLSTQSSTAKDLVDSLTSATQGKNRQAQAIKYCWILGTMNRNYSNPLVKLIQYTKNAFQKNNIPCSQPSLISTPKSITKDHRKMLYILVWRKKVKPKLNSRADIDNFIKNISVPLATIGSSNFSKATYFMGNDHNEADILWVDDAILKKISIKKRQKAEQINDEMITKNEENSRNSQSNRSSDNNMPGIVSAKVYSLDSDSEYLKQILEQSLNAILA